MVQDAKKKFIVDFSNEIFTRDELVEMIDHAIASLVMMTDTDSIEYHRADVATPLTLLHQFFYLQKRDEMRARLEQFQLTK